MRQQELYRLLDAERRDPLLASNTSRFHFHVTDQELREKYEEHLSVFWTPNEIDTHADVRQWSQLPDQERRFLSRILAFFATVDGIVFENVTCNFGAEVCIPEARFFYGFQAMMENIHSETYMKILQAYVKEPAEQQELIDAITRVEPIRRKAEWALKYFDTSLPFALRLVAFACVEGIFFSGAFCSIFWFKHFRTGQLEALTFSNQLIARDEALHTEFAVMLFHRLQSKPSEEAVREIVTQAVALEECFVSDVLQVALIGMSAELMSQYIRFVADRLLTQLGYPKIYNATCPFPFMEKQSMRVTSNFFENKVAEYALPPQGSFDVNSVF